MNDDRTCQKCGAPENVDWSPDLYRQCAVCDPDGVSEINPSAATHLHIKRIRELESALIDVWESDCSTHEDNCDCGLCLTVWEALPTGYRAALEREETESLLRCPACELMGGTQVPHTIGCPLDAGREGTDV